MRARQLLNVTQTDFNSFIFSVGFNYFNHSCKKKFWEFIDHFNGVVTSKAICNALKSCGNVEIKKIMMEKWPELEGDTYNSSRKDFFKLEKIRTNLHDNKKTVLCR